MNTRVLTGITTSGTPHLGNYVGAIRPAVEASRRSDVDAFYFLADYHALIKCEDADRIEIDLAPAYDVAGVQNLVRRLEHRRVGAESVVIEDRFAFDTPRSFETAIITGDFRQTGADGLEVWRRQKHLQARIEASSAYEIVAEKVDEEGLAFTRVAVRLAAPQRTGFIRILYLPPG